MPTAQAATGEAGIESGGPAVVGQTWQLQADPPSQWDC
jgi:hypothetical protein